MRSLAHILRNKDADRDTRRAVLGILASMLCETEQQTGQESLWAVEALWEVEALWAVVAHVHELLTASLT